MTHDKEKEESYEKLSGNKNLKHEQECESKACCLLHTLFIIWPFSAHKTNKDSKEIAVKTGPNLLIH